MVDQTGRELPIANGSPKAPITADRFSPCFFISHRPVVDLQDAAELSGRSHVGLMDSDFVDRNSHIQPPTKMGAIAGGRAFRRPALAVRHPLRPPRRTRASIGIRVASPSAGILRLRRSIQYRRSDHV